jgi:integrase
MPTGPSRGATLPGPYGGVSCGAYVGPQHRAYSSGRKPIARARARDYRAKTTPLPLLPHWLRHAHVSHAIDRGASLPEVQTTLGHGNIATTSGYLHARPDTSSGLHLDPGVFLR